MTVKFSIGTDPEFVLRSKKLGRYVSAINYISGTKLKPEYLDNGAALSYDNVAIEFATPPAQGETEFVRIVQQTLELAQKALPKDLYMVCVPSCIMHKKELEHEEAKKFACDPDFNAWKKGKINAISKDAQGKQMRSFGGHIHIGLNKNLQWIKDPVVVNKFVQFLDTTLGFASTVLDNNAASKRRRKLYGNPGAYRIPNHGIEYRTLSNFWLKHPKSVRLMYRLVQDSLTFFENFSEEHLMLYIGPYRTQQIIKEGHSDYAHRYLSSFYRNHLLKPKTWNIYTECRELFKPKLSIQQGWKLRKAA